jgi:hypothetical protein
VKDAVPQRNASVVLPLELAGAHQEGDMYKGWALQAWHSGGG